MFKKNNLKKYLDFINQKIIFYRKVAIVKYDISNYKIINDITLQNYQKFNVKRIITLNPKIEKKLNAALLKVDFSPLPFTINEAKKRLTNGYHLIIMENNDEIIGWTWDAVRSYYIPELNEKIDLKQNECFSYNTYIDKRFRNKGLNKIMLHGKIASLYNEGFEKEWGHIWAWNIPSLKSFTGMGWVIIGYIYYFKFFFIKIKYRSYSKNAFSI
jgi:hypothetical protein